MRIISRKPASTGEEKKMGSEVAVYVPADDPGAETAGECGADSGAPWSAEPVTDSGVAESAAGSGKPAAPVIDITGKGKGKKSSLTERKDMASITFSEAKYVPGAHQVSFESPYRTLRDVKILTMNDVHMLLRSVARYAGVPGLVVTTATGTEHTLMFASEQERAAFVRDLSDDLATDGEPLSVLFVTDAEEI
jgi:hypothetical protein